MRHKREAEAVWLPIGMLDGKRPRKGGLDPKLPTAIGDAPFFQQFHDGGGGSVFERGDYRFGLLYGELGIEGERGAQCAIGVYIELVIYRSGRCGYEFYCLIEHVLVIGFKPCLVEHVGKVAGSRHCSFSSSER